MNRHTQLLNWLEHIEKNGYINLTVASADASFRQYFRVTHRITNKTYIVMDAPPDKENCQPFINVTQLIRHVGVNAPKIIAQDLTQGFLLLDDLGTKPYLDKLDNDTAEPLYRDAINALLKMQKINAKIPLYNQPLLQSELALFETWYLNKHLNFQLDNTQKKQLQQIFQSLIKNAQEQPQVFVHRDFHARNLMVTEQNNPGVIDYQDAVIGAISYDLVSLLKDCYIEWSREKIEYWVKQYLTTYQQQTSTQNIPFAKFIKWFDLMGVQRHLKVLGIFSRLNYRDLKPQYLKDIPLTLKYLQQTCTRYGELSALADLLKLAAKK